MAVLSTVARNPDSYDSDIFAVLHDIAENDPYVLGGDSNAHGRFTFVNDTDRSGKAVRSGQWSFSNQNQIAMARLFGFVHPSSQLHVLGTLQGKMERWFNLENVAKSMKHILALHCPDDIPANDPIRLFWNIQARNIFYIMRKAAGLPDLDDVMAKRETEPTLDYDLRPWILNHDGKTVIRTTVKHWESTSAQPVSSNTVPLDIYNMQPDPTAAPANSLPPTYDDYTIETWPNPTGYAYSELPDASLYKLVRVETRDPTDALVSRRDWDIRLTRNVAVLVDVCFRLWDIVDKVTGRRQATYQLVIQQVKILKSPPLGNFVYHEDLETRPTPAAGPSTAGPTTPTRSKRRAVSPPVPIALSPPTKRPMPSTPSSSRRAAPPGSRSNAEPAPPPSYEADEEMHGLDRFRQDWADEIQQRRAENAEVPEDVNGDGAKDDDDVPMTSTPRDGRDTRRSAKAKGKKVDRSA